MEISKEGGRCLKCLDCRSKTWITSSTFFKGIKKPLPYLALIYFLESGIALNSVELSILSGVTQSSAWEIIKKFSLVANACLSDEGERIPIQRIYRAIYKRSRKTPRDCSPAQEVNQEAEAAASSTAISISMLESSSEPQLDQYSLKSELAEHDRAIFEAIGQSPIHADDLCSKLKLGPAKILPSLTILELDGLIESVAGNRYIRKLTNPISEPPSSKSISQYACTMIEALIEFACSTYKGISKKYSQLYVALMWMTEEGERRGWKAILERCRKFTHFNKKSIARFVTGSNLVLPLPRKHDAELTA
ncbi:hypothetical protein GC174_00270 [bacterium]|nr:hypothetical protein [bacterium]